MSTIAYLGISMWIPDVTTALSWPSYSFFTINNQNASNETIQCASDSREELFLQSTSRPCSPTPLRLWSPSVTNAAPPDITAAFSNLTLTDIVFPTPDQCIAHLKVLESFHQLREDVAVRDGLFGITDAFVSGDESKEKQAEILMKIREKRWAVFVAKAAQRFKAWWTVCVQPHAVRMMQSHLIDSRLTQGARVKFEAEDLPPLGKQTRCLSSIVCWTIFVRCHHGLACLSVEPPRLSRRLPSIWQDGFLEIGFRVGCRQFMHR